MKPESVPNGDGKGKTVAAGLFASILVMALIFMLYVLANFYLEAKRAHRRAPLRRKGVVAFRAASGLPTALITAGSAHQAESSTGDVEMAKEDLLPIVLPIGVRRLAAKRVPRS